MVFSSLFFLYFFLPLNLILYFIIKNTAWRNGVLIFFSLFFYAWGEPVWVFVLMLSLAHDFLCGREIEAFRGTHRARRALIRSIAVNLSLLGIFKYTGLLVETAGTLLHLPLPVPQLSLPIGISFYSFQALSYVVDVYRGQVKAQPCYHKLLLYVSLYPQLVAGPIVRYHDIAAEIDKRQVTGADLRYGTSRLIFGLTKKVLVANTAGRLLETYTQAPTDTLSVAGAWFGMLLFTLQIYYDFSAYSDMAIGLGRLFGFHYLENFNYPYISKSVTEFWRRWHISLSSFFRDYVYIPLGGRRSHAWRNLFIVWLLTGLWHGASWNFVLWGLYYGLFIALERLILRPILARLPAIFSHLYLLVVVVLGWTLFYFTDFTMLGAYLRVMFGMDNAPLWDTALGITIQNHIFWLIGSVLFCLPIVPYGKRFLARHVEDDALVWLRMLQTVACMGLLILCTCLLAGQSFNPFLYFRF